MSLTHALVVKLIAKPDHAEELKTFLEGALPLAQAEEFTPIWFALREGETTFYIVDAFAGSEDRLKHLEGSIAAALMARADELLAEPPHIGQVDVLASKVVSSA